MLLDLLVKTFCKVVYKFECGWCDVSYVGSTHRHLYRQIDEHKRSGSIFNHSHFVSCTPQPGSEIDFLIIQKELIKKRIGWLT